MLAIQRLSTVEPDFLSNLKTLLAFEAAADENIERTVANILADVKTRGDAAVIEYTNKFDRLTAKAMIDLELRQDELRRALDGLPSERRTALEAAASRIRAYHERQKMEGWSYAEADGTMLMNAIPAKVAGVPELVMVTPTPGGVRNPLVLAAAAIAGVDRVFTIGGAQAVGALAYGTATVPSVDKIVGPGNAYVAEAKRRVGIDMIAGPSEVLVMADSTANPDWIAADLLAQAEHDTAAQSILLTDDASLADSVVAALERQLATLPRKEIAGASWRDFGCVILCENLSAALPLVDRIAPEHLEIMSADADALTGRVRNAGAIFVGGHTPEAIGDYVGGSNHVLPTARSARFSSGLGVLDFMKRTSILKCSPDALRELGPAAIALGEAESLDAHARSVAIRMNLR